MPTSLRQTLLLGGWIIAILLIIAGCAIGFGSGDISQTLEKHKDFRATGTNASIRTTNIEISP